ncbi:MAG: phosphatase PAP2 family protein [Hydrogenophilus sp.]|nr:phosphatase PAP2 family protein [Hydrogenophilus sp.]
MTSSYPRAFPLSRQRRKLPSLLAAAGGVLLVLALLLRAPELNQPLFLTLNALLQTLPHPLWGALSNLGATSVAAALLLLLALWSLRPLLLATLMLLPTTFLVHTLKHLLADPRPAALLSSELFTLLEKPLKSGAFPSGHTATATILAIAIALTPSPPHRLLHTALLPLLPLAVIAIALSRIAVGAHWPSDLLAGVGVAFLGAAATLCSIVFYPPLLSTLRRRRRLLLTLTAAIALYAPFDAALYRSGAAIVWVITPLSLLAALTLLRR